MVCMVYMCVVCLCRVCSVCVKMGMGVEARESFQETVCAFYLAVPGFPCFCLAVHSSIAGWWVVSDNSPVSGSRTAGITDGITVVLF